MPSQKDPIIVTNGDIIFIIGFKDILGFHEHNNADATMAIRPHEWQNPFGVVEVQGIEIKAFKEKPITRTFINAGVYAINPASLGLLDQNEYLDMPNFLKKSVRATRKLLPTPHMNHGLISGGLRICNFRIILIILTEESYEKSALVHQLFGDVH